MLLHDFMIVRVGKVSGALTILSLPLCYLILDGFAVLFAIRLHLSESLVSIPIVMVESLLTVLSR